MENRIIECFGGELRELCLQAEEILEKTKEIRSCTLTEYLTILSVAQFAGMLHVDAEQIDLMQQMREYEDCGTRYFLPLLSPKEYILVRNLLENNSGEENQNGSICRKLLETIRRDTKTVFYEKTRIPDGQAIVKEQR